MNTETSDFLSVLRFLHYLRKYFVVLVLSTGLISFLVFEYLEYKKRFAASARFIVNNLPGTNTPETVGTDSDLRAMRSNSMQLFFSTEVMNHLMDKFDLYSCYRVNRDSLLGRERLMKAIRASIQFKLEKIGGHELIVTSFDRHMSAVIANALIDETDRLNRKLLNEEVMRKAEIMDNLIQRSNLNMTRNIDSLSSLTKFLKPQKVKSSEQEDLETRLYNALALLQQNMETMSRTRDYYDVILKSNLTDNFQFFYVIAQATPDYKNYFRENMAIATMLGIIITLMTTMMIYYVQKQLSNVRALGLYPEKAEVPSKAATKTARPALEEPIIPYPAKVT